MKSKAHSASSLKTLEQCELQYYLKYVGGGFAIEDMDPTHATDFGSSVHAALEYLYKKHNEDLSARFTAEDYDAVYEEFMKAAAEYKVNDVKLLEEGWSIVKERMDTFDYSEKAIAIERRFDIETAAGTRFMGFIDKVVELDEDTIAIVDYKTSKMAMTQSKADSDIQLSMYDLAASILWPEYPNVVIVLDYLRLKPVMSYRTKLQRKLFSDFLDKTEEYILSKEEKDVKPTLNSLCGWCSFRNQCPSFLSAINEDENVKKAVSNPTPEQMVEEWGRLKSNAKAIGVATRTLQMKIDEYLSRTGNSAVHGDGVKLAPTQSTRVSYNVDALRGVIPDKDLLDMCSVNTRAVNNYLSDHGDISKKVRDLANVSYTAATFRVSKAKK